MCALLALGVAPGARAAMAPPPFAPEDGNTWDAYLADQESYDSNLYRLPPNFVPSTVAIPNASKSDYYNTASAGADGQLARGQQLFALALRVDENRFARNTVLDNTAYDGTFLWNWRVGGHFSGTAGVDFNHALAGFDETRYLGRDLVNSARYYGSARYQIGPRWAVYGTVNDSDITHSAEAAQFQDFKSKAGSGGIEYATDLNDTFALEYRYSRGEYPTGTVNSQGGVTFSPDFHDQLTQFVVKYAISDKTLITAQAGYVKRDYPNTNVGSFSGDQGRITVAWQATGKTQLTVAGWRELHAYLVSQADYFVSKGGSVGPVWAATDKLKLSVLFSFEDQDYLQNGSIPNPQAVPITGPLHARLKTESMNITYTPRDNWIIKGTYNYTQRTSNQVNFEYTDDLATVGILYRFH